MATKTYTKVPGGRGSSAMSYHRLWTATDHLLAVSNTYGSETYKRYAFTDIQAFVLHRTGAWAVGVVVLGLMLIIFLMPALLGSDSALRITMGVFAGLFALFLIIHLLSGPTVKLYVQTATSHDELSGVNRLRKARKVMRHLAPMIEHAQSEHEATRAAFAAATAPQPPPLPSAEAPAPEPQP